MTEETSPIEVDEEAISEIIRNGGKATVIYVSLREISSKTGRLIAFDRRKSVDFSQDGENGKKCDHYVPILAENGSAALIKITDEEGRKTFYRNKLVDQTYSEDTAASIRKKCGFDSILK
jgi:hypothetical protein